MYASESQWRVWEGGSLACSLAPSTPNASWVAQQLSDGDLWETCSPRFPCWLWSLEASCDYFIHISAWYQLVWSKKRDGHACCVWRVSLHLFPRRAKSWAQKCHGSCRITIKHSKYFIFNAGLQQLWEIFRCGSWMWWMSTLRTHFP